MLSAQFLCLFYLRTDRFHKANRGIPEDLEAGTYGLANAALGSSWPKVTSGIVALDQELESGPTPDGLLHLLADASVPADRELPSRGRPIELERRIAPRFINGEEYGTRASTAVIFSAQGISFAEQEYGSGGSIGNRCDFYVGIES